MISEAVHRLTSCSCSFYTNLTDSCHCQSYTHCSGQNLSRVPSRLLHKRVLIRDKTSMVNFMCMFSEASWAMESLQPFIIIQHNFAIIIILIIVILVCLFPVGTWSAYSWGLLLFCGIIWGFFVLLTEQTSNLRTVLICKAWQGEIKSEASMERLRRRRTAHLWMRFTTISSICLCFFRFILHLLAFPDFC